MNIEIEWYKPTEKVFIHDLPAIKRKSPIEPGIYEYCTFGKYGQIWEYDRDTFSVLVYTKHWKAMKDVNNLAINAWDKLPKGEKSELLLKVPKNKANELKLAIKVPKSIGNQVTLAKRFKLNLHLN